MLKIPLWLNHVEKYHDGRPQNGKQPRKWKMAMERLASPKQGHSPCPWKHIMIFTNPWTWDKNCLGTEVSTPNDKNHFPGKYQASIEAELMYSVSEVWVASFTWSAYALQREKIPRTLTWGHYRVAEPPVNEARLGSDWFRTFAGLGMEQFRWEET